MPLVPSAIVHRRCFSAGCILAALGSLIAGAAEEARPRGWDYLESNRFEEALTSFRERLRTPAADSSASEIGYVLALLNTDARGGSSLAEVQQRLQRVRDSAPASQEAIIALYLQARAAAARAEADDYDRAIQLYRTLLHDHRDSYWAEMGATKYALLVLYQPLTPAARLARFTELESLDLAWSHAELKGQYHLTLAFAALRFALPDQTALRHFLEFEQAITQTGWAYRSLYDDDISLAIAEFARRAGRIDLARQYYLRFLENSPRERRKTMVEERLASLPPAAEASPHAK